MGAFCLDPDDAGKAMGAESKLPLEGMCDLFDGECAVYEGFGVDRVVAARYVAADGSDKSIDVVLSRFKSAPSAFAMFTKRTVGDGDPADPASPKPFAVPGAAALGLGNAYVWRGSHIVEITYSDSKAAPAEVEAAGAKVLPELAELVARSLPGEPRPLPEVAALPTENRIPIGVRYAPAELWKGVKDAGGGAVGYYKLGDKRWRVAVLERSDEAAAKAAMAALAKLPGAAAVTGLADEAVRLEVKDGGVQVEWLVARKGARLTGVGDEARALRSGASAEERAKISLTEAEKKAHLEK